MNSSDIRLVLRDIPIMNYVMGLVFAAFGGFVLYQGGPPLALLFLAAGLAILVFAKVLIITADRSTRILKLEYRSAIRYSRREFSFDDITGISTQVVQGSKNRSYFRVALRQKGGDLASFAGNKRRAAKLRDFIGVPDFDSSVAGMAYAALSSYTGKSQETDGMHWALQPGSTIRWHSPDFKTTGFFLCIAQKGEGQSSGGLLASVGGMIYRKMLAAHFRPDDIPGLDGAATLAPLDPALEPHFIAYSNAPDAARPILNSKATMLLASWGGRYPARSFQKVSNFGMLTVLFCPSGVYLAPTELLRPNQVDELAALGTELVKSQRESHAHSTF